MNEIPDSRLLEVKELLLPSEVASILRISKRTVYNLYYDGRLTGIKVRSCLRITTESVRELLSEDE